MAIGIQNYDDISPADSEYPDGNIKDDTGADDGTPVSKLVYADVHQVLAKLLRMAEITASGNPENEYSGFQYVEAINALFGDGRKVITISTTGVGNLAEAAYGTRVVFLEGSGAGTFITMKPDASFPLSTITIENYSYNSVELFDFAGTNNINGSAPPFLHASRSVIKFQFDSASSNWVIMDRYLIE